MDSFLTEQERKLVESMCCAGVTARALGLSFANRDGELIQYLATQRAIPDASELPSRQACMAVMEVSDRWASMVLERVGQFMRKAARGNDYSEPYAHFLQSTDVQTLNTHLQKLAVGMTFFIGDSNMDFRHWSSDASYPILAGMHLQHLGRGDFINAGVGGETAREGLARFDASLMNHSPGKHFLARTVIAFGSNDVTRGYALPDILQAIGDLVGLSVDRGSQVVLQGVMKPVSDRLWWMPAPPAADSDQRILELNEALRQLALKLGAGFLDIAAIATDDDRCSDGIHFNQIGQNKIARLLLKTWATG